MTLLLSFCQAVTCGEFGAQLISPFVGGICSWYKKSAGQDWDEAANAGAKDPGVKSVGDIHSYFKQQGITTEVIGASFRNVGQVRALAGCDLMTSARSCSLNCSATTSLCSGCWTQETRVRA